MKVLVTGASGFVGRRLCQSLNEHNHQVTAAVRSSETPDIDGAASRIIIGDIGKNTDWSLALVGQDAIIHLAARAHVMNETTPDPEPLYHQVNVDGTQQIIEQAKAAGVRRLLFLSSVKVNGEQTTTAAYTEAMPAMPEDAYGRTKWAAEQLLNAEPGLDVTIIRSPLVYGPGVKGNFAKLIGLCQRGWPLPLGAIKNQRSFVFLDNLVDALINCLENTKSIGQTFLVSDGADVSTPELFRLVSTALGKPSSMVPVPVFLLELAGRLTGKSGAINRLRGSLQIDCRHIEQTLGWKAPR